MLLSLVSRIENLSKKMMVTNQKDLKQRWEGAQDQTIHDPASCYSAGPAT